MSEPIDFEKAQKQLVDRSRLVACAHCGRDIPMLSSRCPECGVHFDGVAFQFEPQPEREPRNPFLVVLIAVLGIALVVALVLMGTSHL